MSANKLLNTENDFSTSTEVMGANLKNVRSLSVKSSGIVFSALISSSPSNICQFFI